MSPPQSSAIDRAAWHLERYAELLEDGNATNEQTAREVRRVIAALKERAL